MGSHGDTAGDADRVIALAAGAGRVFAAGFGSNAAGNQNFLVRAYVAKTGMLVWADLDDKAGLDDATLALAAGAGRVVAGGVGTTATDDMDVLIRAYDMP